MPRSAEIGMNEGGVEAEAGEAGLTQSVVERVRIMSTQSDIDGQAQVLR
ncbi:MAG: hypothetical protein WBG08_07675 [Litorimonas sp.]